MSAAYMLLGAGLAVIGMLATALCDRIRGTKYTAARREPRESRPRENVVALATAVRAAEGPVTDAHKTLRRDVIAALVQSGFARVEATEAVDGCAGSAQSTIDSWLRAALKRANTKEAA